MTPLGKINAASEAVRKAAGDLSNVSGFALGASSGLVDRIGPAADELGRAAQEVRFASRGLSAAGGAWEDAGHVAARLFVLVGAVIVARFAWDVFKDLRTVGS